MSILDGQLLAAHAANNLSDLIALYEQASTQAKTPVAKGFYLTHAFIFALEAGDKRAAMLRQRLASMGRI